LLAWGVFQQAAKPFYLLLRRRAGFLARTV
jgi:hypothetical protein